MKKILVTLIYCHLSAVCLFGQTIEQRVAALESSLGTNNRAYVASNATGEVAVIDTFKNEVIQTITVGGNPNRIALVPRLDSAYVTNSNGNVSVINTKTLQKIDIQVGGQPLGITANRDGSRVYVAKRTSEYSVIDTSTNRVIQTGLLGSGNNSTDLVLNRAGTKLYVAASVKETITNIFVFNTANNSRIYSFAASFSSGLAINQDETRFYVPSLRGNSVPVYNVSVTPHTTVTNHAVGTEPMSVVINPAETRLYVANRGSNNISVIDTRSNRVLPAIDLTSTPFGVGGEPSSLAINSQGTRLYVANARSNNVAVIDTATNAVIALIAVRNPSGVAVQ